MKYISFIDQLGIDVDQLSNIDNNEIIKLQKQLKAKAMLGDANNLGEVAHLIDKLKDETTRQHHIFIEKHPWLKQLISGNYKDIKQSEITIDNSLINDLEGLKNFLAPFLKENIKVFLSESLSKGKYVHILKTLLNNTLFTEEINQLVINFFKARLNYATVYLREKRLKEKQYPVAFITNKAFINCLNQYPDRFNEEMIELNSEVIDIYNSKRKNINNYEFKFTAKAMVAFGLLDTSHSFLEQTLVSNAEIAREYTLPSQSNQKTGSGLSGWSIFVGIVIVIRVILLIAKNTSSSSSNYDYINTGNYNIEQSDALKKALESIKKNSNTTYNQDEIVVESKRSDHIVFAYMLNRKIRRKTESSGALTLLGEFSNPYPKTFNEVPYTEEKNDKAFLKIDNRSKQDLIVFRLTEGVDQSVFIPKGKQLAIKAIKNDSLLFYTGETFISTKLSHFRDNVDLSDIYEITSYDTLKNKTIKIYPFRDKITVKKDIDNPKKIVTDTIRKARIKTSNLQLRNIDIIDMYKDYYNRKYGE